MQLTKLALSTQTATRADAAATKRGTTHGYIDHSKITCVYVFSVIVVSVYAVYL